MTTQSKWRLFVTLMAIWVSIIGVREMTKAPSPKTSPSTARMMKGERQGMVRSVSLPTVTPANERFETPKNIFLPLRGVTTPTPARVHDRTPAPPQSMTVSVPTPLVILQPVPMSPPSLPQVNQALETLRRQRQQAEQQGRQELTEFRFLGFLTSGGGKRAFLSKGSVMYLVESGDTVDGHVEVVMIDAGSMTLRHAIGNVETTLVLSKTTEVSR